MNKRTITISILALTIIHLLSCNNIKKENDESTLLNIKTSNDTIIFYDDFKSNFVDSRNIAIWLPAGYDYKQELNYKVLYMHDGQMLFDSTTTWNKQEWGIDETLGWLIKNGDVQKTIVVGIWNNGNKRFVEYMPNKPRSVMNSPDALKTLKENFHADSLISDYYLKFLVYELKPFIEVAFKVSTKPVDNAIMGSSMGGLISLYAICEYPDLFGSAGCISTHWPVPYIGDAFISQLETSLPSPNNHKVYFDFGTKTLDEQYEPYQLKVDEIMQKRGFVDGVNWVTKKFEGADHSERSWKARVKIPLTFLLK